MAGNRLGFELDGILQVRESLKLFLKSECQEAIDAFKSSSCHGEFALRNLRNNRTMLEAAELFIWRPSIWNAALAGAAALVGEVVTVEDIPLKPQLWVFAPPFYIPDYVADHYEVPQQAICFGWLVRMCVTDYKSQSGYPERTSEQIKAEWKPGDPPPVGIGVTTIYYVAGRSFLDSFFFRDHEAIPGGVPLGEEWCEFLAAKRFMCLPIVEHSVQQPSRHTRRRARHDDTEVPAVRIITLRRKETTNDGEDASRNVEWSCRWLVRAHWRKQYIPGQEERRPTYVQPHVKGPEDKPLKAPQESIFVVKR